MQPLPHGSQAPADVDGIGAAIEFTIRFRSFELVRRCRSILWAASSTSDDRKLVLFRSFELVRECDVAAAAVGIPIIDDGPLPSLRTYL